MVESSNYGSHMRRARFEAANRLGLEELRSPVAAGELLGIKKGHLHAIENGTKKPSFDLLERMAETYGCMIGDLLPSSAPSGPEVDKIIGPLATLPPDTRARFITQMSAFARLLSAELSASNVRAITQPEIMRQGESSSGSQPPTDVVRPPVGLRPTDLDDDDERPNAPRNRSSYRIHERR